MSKQLNLRGVHVFKKLPGQNRWVLDSIHPALRLAQDGETVYIQDGSLFDGGGNKLLGKPPGWFSEAVSKLSPDTLASVKYKPAAAKA